MLFLLSAQGAIAQNSSFNGSAAPPAAPPGRSFSGTLTFGANNEHSLTSILVYNAYDRSIDVDATGSAWSMYVASPPVPPPTPPLSPPLPPAPPKPPPPLAPALSGSVVFTEYDSSYISTSAGSLSKTGSASGTSPFTPSHSAVRASQELLSPNGAYQINFKCPAQNQLRYIGLVEGSYNYSTLTGNSQSSIPYAIFCSSSNGYAFIFESGASKGFAGTTAPTMALPAISLTVSFV